MFTKIDVRLIVGEHFDSLRNFATGRVSVGDLFVFFGVPLLLVICSIYFRYDFGNEARSALVNASAIFLGLLLNLLVLMFDQQGKNSDRVKAASCAEPRDAILVSRLSLFRTVIDQTISNISFTTLLSILALLLLIVHSILLDSSGSRLPVVTTVISAATLGVWLCILLTSMMILKRVFSLLINDKSAQPPA